MGYQGGGGGGRAQSLSLANAPTVPGTDFCHSGSSGSVFDQMNESESLRSKITHCVQHQELSQGILWIPWRRLHTEGEGSGSAWVLTAQCESFTVCLLISAPSTADQVGNALVPLHRAVRKVDCQPLVCSPYSENISYHNHCHCWVDFDGRKLPGPVQTQQASGLAMLIIVPQWYIELRSILSCIAKAKKASRKLLQRQAPDTCVL